MTVTEVVTITDDEGLYEGVVPLRAGRGRTYDRTTLLEVQAAAPGHRETARLVTGIPSSLETLLPDLTLRPGCVVRGRVLRADGEAAPDVEVFLIHDRRNDVFAEAVTDEGGRYVLDTGPHDVSTTYWLAAVSCAQGQGTGERFELWRAGEYEFGDLKLEAPLVIEGTVTYADGEPVGRADVGATALDDDDPATLRNPWTGVEVWEHCDPYVQTDAQGRFRLVVHSPGDWCVSTTSFPEVVERVVPAGRMDLRFQIHAHALDVTVVDEHDDPLPGAWVVLQCWEPLYAEEAASLLDAGVPRTGSAYPPSRRDVRVTGRDGMTRKFVASGSLCAIGVLLDMEVVREPPTWQVVRVDPDRNESAVEIRTSTE
jgi:hypothetical protein